MRKLIFIFWCLTAAALNAQQNVFTADIDTNRLLIGEHIKLSLRAEVEEGSNFMWPQFPDTISEVELISQTGVDTNGREGLWRLSQELTLTSFDTGYQAVPPLILQLGDRRLISEAIAIEVLFPELPEEQEYFDIKKPLEVGRNWWLIIALILGIAILVALIIWAIRYFRKNKGRKVPPEMRLPPHEWALQQLDELESSGLWQKGNEKEYYSRLIDILRLYLKRQMHIPAMESTAEELIEQLRELRLPKELFNELKEMLRLGAFVKYARQTPTEAVNRNSMDVVRKFVHHTRPVETKEDTNA